MLNVGTATSDVNLNATVTSNAGSVSVTAQDSVNQNANGNISVTFGTGTIFVRAVTGSITMVDGTNSTTADGSVRYHAAQNVTVGLIDAGTGSIGIEATAGDILDARTDTVSVGTNGFATQTGSARTVNLIANNLVLRAGDDIGTAGNALDTTVNTLAAIAGSDLYVYESDALTIGSITVFDANRVNLNSTTTPITTAALAGITATAGNANIETIAGSVEINNVIAAGQHGLLNAGGLGSDLVLNAKVQSFAGNLTLNAADDVSQRADLSTGGVGSIYLRAINNQSDALTGIVMQNRTSTTTAGGNVRLVADNESDILLSIINAATGDVSLNAERSILDNNGDQINILADALRMLADATISSDGSVSAINGDAAGAIGGSETSNADVDANVNAIDTQVTTLAAISAEGIYVREADGLTVAATGAISVSQRRLEGTETILTDATLSDLTATNDGVIKLQASTGSLVLNDGDGDNVAVSANGAGDILLQTLTGNITANASIESDSGHITIDAASVVDLSAAVTTGNSGMIAVFGSGTISIDAPLQTTDGDILLQSGLELRLARHIQSTMGDIGLISTSNNIIQFVDGDITTGGDVFVEARDSLRMDAGTVITAGGGEFVGRAIEEDIELGRINAVRTALAAGGNISDSNGSIVNIDGTSLIVRAGLSFGTSTEELETQITTLAATAGTGFFLTESDSLIIGELSNVTSQPLNWVHVNFNSTKSPATASRTGVALEDVTTTNGGSISIVTNGLLTITGGNDAIGIAASGTGNVRLETVGNTSDLLQKAAVNSETGNITLKSARDLIQNNIGDVSTSGADVLITAARSWTMSTDTVVSNPDGAVGGITISGDISLGQILADNIALKTNQSIRDINGMRMNLVAGTANLRAGLAIGDHNSPGSSPGSLADAIDTQADTIAATATYGIYLNESNGFVVGQIAEQTIGGSLFNSLGGLQTTNSDVSLNVTGDLTLQRSIVVGSADVRVTATGNVTQASTGTIFANELGVRQESTARGDIRLFAANGVNIAAFHNRFDGGDVTFADSDNLTIRSVSDQNVGVLTFTATTGITATGGDIHMRSIGDLTVLKSISSVNGVVDETLASGETITLESVDGNIMLDATGGSLLITTDEDEVNGSKPVTGDKITLLADSNQSYNGDLDGDNIPDANDPDVDGDGILNAADEVVNGMIQGRVTFLSDVTLSTDGGVAKKFGPRPAVGVPDTAFFQFISSPLPLEHDNVPARWNNTNAYINAFAVLIGISGEENLTVDIDWQDPEDDTFLSADEEDKDRRIAALQMIETSPGIYNQLTTDRIQHFLVEKGGPATDSTLENTNGQIIVGHLYTALDYTRFQNEQHRTTINIDFSVSHHESIQLKAASIAQDGPAQTVPGSVASTTDDRSTKSAPDPKDPNGPEEDDIFENGIASFKIPTTTPAPPALFTNTFMPRADRPFNVAPPENQAAVSAQSTAEFGGGAVGGSVFSTEVYFQIRRQYETDGPAEVVVERITDSSLISSREAFEKFVQQNPELQDGAGYEIWLISETGGQKVERPIVEFEISGGQPGTMNESVPEGSPKQKLIDLQFEQPVEPDTIPEAQAPEIPQASLDVDSALLESAHNATSPEINNADRDVSTASESEQETSTLVSEALSPSSAALVGLMVRRFRKRQQESATAQSTFSRAARFQRRHSSPIAEIEVRGSSDV